MRNLQAFFIEPDLVVRELPNGGVEIQRGVLADATEVSRDQLADTIAALRAVRGDAEPGVADKIIALLLARNGFDHWWDSVDVSDRLDIRNEIAGLLTR